MNETTNLDRVSPKAEARSNRYSGRIEKLLDGFEPSFEFSRPAAAAGSRVRRARAPHPARGGASPGTMR